MADDNPPLRYVNPPPSPDADRTSIDGVVLRVAPVVRIQLPPVRPIDPPTADEEYMKDIGAYHPLPIRNEVVNDKKTSWPLQEERRAMTDQSENSATYSVNDGQIGNAVLSCRDGRKLSGSQVVAAVKAVRDADIRDMGVFTDNNDYTQIEGSPLETTCRFDHNRREHDGREP